MKDVYIMRFRTSDQGTEGILITSDGFECKTLELPWRDNIQTFSCVPSGEYIVKIRVSPRFGKTYWVTNVPNRSYILIHQGNYAGRKDKGLKTSVAGCILLGRIHGFLGGQRAILNSRISVRAFMNHMNHQEFHLKIIGGDS